MKLLLLGSTGLLGQAVAAEARARRWAVCGAARSGAARALDIADDKALRATLAEVSPDLVFNCAGLVDVERCEEDPGLAYRINARPLALLAEWSIATGRPLVQVSTDHFYPECGDRAHPETDPVRFANEYARSKYAGEAFALTAPAALVLRTSIVGIRGWERPSFAEWAIEALLDGQPMTLFADAWTSSIHVAAFASAAFDLVGGSVRGLLNLAAGEPYSKAAFIQELARQLGREAASTTIGSCAVLKPPRAASLGLNVTRAEERLGYKLPRLHQVVAGVLKQHRERPRA